MSQPAWAIASSGLAAHEAGSRSCAMFGSRPITTNSVMPMPKLPMASERSAHIAAPLDEVEVVTRQLYPRSVLASNRFDGGLEAFDLAVDLAGVPRADVGLQHERDPGAERQDGLGGAL